MKPDDNVVYLNQQDKKAARVGQSASSVMDALRELAVGRLCQILGTMLDSVDDALFELAEKAENNAAQTLYFDAMRMTRLQRPDVEKSFKGELSGRFDKLVRARSIAPAANVVTALDEFSLLDPDQLEEELALSGMINKARVRYDISLAHLEARFEWLLKGEKIASDENPLDPKTICEAFAVANQHLDVEIKARLIIFKLFDKHVMSGLQVVYDEVNKFLSDAGVLPGLKANVRPVRPGAVAQEKAQSASDSVAAYGEPPLRATAAQTTAEVGREASESAAEGEVLQLLHALLMSRRQPSSSPMGAGVADGNYVSGPPLRTEELLQTLSHIQREATAPLSATGAGLNLKSVVLNEVVAAHRGADVTPLIRPIDDDIIDVVSMLFDFILDDPNLAGGIKALIGRLQIPVLKVALIDKTFFSKKRHPARVLLNELAQAGLGWSDSDRSLDDPIYRNIDASVNRILQEYEDDNTVFEAVLGDFQLTMEAARKRAQVIETRTRQAAEGKAKVDAARERVAREINDRIRGRSIPVAVERLLFEGWSKVLFIVCLKEGEESLGWQNGLRVVDELLWSVEPKPDVAERKKLIALIPGLLQELREGLSGILFNPVELDSLFHELEACHVAGLNAQEQPSSVDVDAMSPSPNEIAQSIPAQSADDSDVHEVGEMLDQVWASHQKPAPPSPIRTVTADVLNSQHADRSSFYAVKNQQPVASEATQDRADLAPYLSEINKVKIDTWFEFAHGADHVRAKLAARLSQGTRFVFVNRSGFKVAEKTLDELAIDMRDGAATILDDAALFDKALEAVIGNLRSMHAKNKL